MLYLRRASSFSLVLSLLNFLINENISSLLPLLNIALDVLFRFLQVHIEKMIFLFL